ncbi:MAG: hypothetical protein MZU97_09745 [Bacillus subtilis]|nr:hypothetical protein [Bacillus subtilis]
MKERAAPRPSTSSAGCFPEAKCELQLCPADRPARRGDAFGADHGRRRERGDAVALFPVSGRRRATRPLEGAIEDAIRHLGLFRAKAKHIRAAAAVIATGRRRDPQRPGLS